MSYTFHLETLLKVRENAVKIHQIEMNLQKERVYQLLQQEKLLEKEIQGLEEIMKENRQQGSLAQEASTIAYVIHLQKTFHVLASQRKEEEENLFSKQQALTEALKKRKIVEKLKEKHYSHWLQRVSHSDHDEKISSPFFF